MTTPGIFVGIVAEAIGLPHATVVLHDRYLLEAGYRSKGARGVNAAKVTARDAAHLVTAILASGEVKDAVASVRRYEAAQPLLAHSGSQSFNKSGITLLSQLPPDHSFLDGLEALLQAAADGHIPRDAIIEVGALSPRTSGDIRLAGISGKPACYVRYGHRSPWDTKKRPSAREAAAWEARMKKQPQSDLEQYRRVTAHTILKLGQSLALNDGGK